MVLEQIWLKTLFIFFLLTQTLVNLPRLRKLLWVIILSELVVAVVSIYTGSNAGRDPHSTAGAERFFGVNQGFLGFNFLGITLSTTIPYIAVLFISKPRWFTRVLLLATLSSTTWMLVLMASRGGILGVLFSVVLTSVLILRVAPRGRIVLVALTSCLLVALWLAPRVLWERLGTLWGNAGSSVVAASAAASTEGRTSLLRRSLEYTWRYPIFGVGLGNFGILSGAETDNWLVTHNTFTQVSSEAGIPALVLFVALLIVVLRRMNALRKIRPITEDENESQLMARATLVSILSFILGCSFASMAYDYLLFYLVAVAVGLQTIASTSQELSPICSDYSSLKTIRVPTVKRTQLLPNR